MAIFYHQHAINVGGVTHYFQGRIKKQGKRLQELFQNSIGLRYIIVDPAYSFSGTYLPDWVALYVHKDNWASDTYVKWWRNTIESIKEE